MTRPRIDFEPLQTDHLPQMCRWLNEGPVLTWYAQRPKSLIEVAHHYGRSISGTAPTRCYRIRIDEEPAGMIKTYLLEDYPEYAAECGAEPGWAGIDYFIGEARFRGRRLAAPMIDRFVQRVVFEDKGVTACVSGPDPANVPSVRALKSAGFLEHGTVHTYVGEELLLIRKRPGRSRSMGNTRKEAHE